MKIALLLEGKKGVLATFQGDFSKTLSTQPELYYLNEIARMNHWEAFDPIISMDIAHFQYAFSKFKPEQHERLVHVILDFFRSKSPSDKLIIDLFIIPTFRESHLPIPDWLLEIKEADNALIQNKKNEMVARIYTQAKGHHDPLASYENEKFKILSWFKTSSNLLSANALKQYLA